MCVCARVCVCVRVCVSVCVRDWVCAYVHVHRYAQCSTLEERLFVLTTLGDDRSVAATYVAGVLQHQRAAVPSASDDHDSYLICASKPKP
jgi:hypothetical protein